MIPITDIVNKKQRVACVPVVDSRSGLPTT